LLQGYIGVSFLDDEDYDLESSVGDLVDSDLDELPVFGFAYEHPLIGRRIQLGVELGSSASFEGDRAYVDVGGATAVVADNDLLLIDLFGGLSVSTVLGQRTRLFLGVGPLLQFGRVELEFDDGMGGVEQIDESGFGAGVYARGGIELELSRGTYVGLTLRHKDAEIGLSDEIDEFEFESNEILISVSRRL
jgi:hypothetical protein